MDVITEETNSMDQLVFSTDQLVFSTDQLVFT